MASIVYGYTANAKDIHGYAYIGNGLGSNSHME